MSILLACDRRMCMARYCNRTLSVRLSVMLMICGHLVTLRENLWYMRCIFMIYRFLVGLYRTRYAGDCHHFADWNAAQGIVVQEAEAVCLQCQLFGRGERRPYHDRTLG